MYNSMSTENFHKKHVLRSVATADVQDISICQVEGDTYSIRCSYLSGSDADGCGYILVSGMNGVENVTGHIERTSSGEEVDLDIAPFNKLLGFDLDSTGELNTISAVEDIMSCHSNSSKSNSCMESL